MDLLERAPHLDELSRLLDAAAPGRGSLVFLGGEAGTGKTALVQAFCRNHAGGSRVLIGACDALSTPRPLGPLIDIARAQGDGLDRLLDGGAPREEVFAAFLAELSHGDKPTVAVFEDVHWADDATLDLLRFLGRRLAGSRSLLLATYRDDDVGPRHPLRIALGDLATAAGVRRLSLPPLTEAAVRALAAGSPLDPAVLYRQTGGNPFFVTEALAAGDGGIPATVRDALLARVARLSVEGRAALETVAVAGTRTEPWLLLELLGPENEALEECLAAGLLVPATEQLSFRHELLRGAVLEAMSPLRSTLLHRSVLAAFRVRADLPAVVARLAHHAEAAGDREAVLQYAPAAARQAAGLKAHREAVAQYSRALRYGDGLQPAARAELLEALAYECFLTDRHAEAVDAWTQALTIRRQLRDRHKEGDILRLLSRPLWYLGRNGEAEATALEALHVLEPLSLSRELGWAYSDLARLRMTARQGNAAIAWGQKATAVGEQLQETELLSHALNNVGCARLHNGDDRGWTDLERSLELALAGNHEEHAGRAYANLATEAIKTFQLDRAERYFAEGLPYTLDHDVQTYYLCMLGHRPMQLFRQGRWNEATDVAGVLLARPDLSPLYRIEGLSALGRVRARRGDPEVPTALDEALDLAAPIGGAWLKMVRAARAEAAWLGGELKLSAREARSAYDESLACNDHWLAGELALKLWQAGELDSAPAVVAEPYALQIAGNWRAAAERWQALGCPYEAAQALADGDEPALREALAIFERLGARPAAAGAARRLRELGVRGIPRGPRSATRANPARLTERELEIWAAGARGTA